MKGLLVTPLLLLAMFAHGQIWCPEGAVWKCNFITGGPYEGCETRTYLGDTLIEGFVAQHILSERIGYDYIDHELDTLVRGTYTRVQDSVVFELIWAPANSSYWDTLYWFGAQVSDHWYRPGLGDQCFTGKMEVDSIFGGSFNGFPLRVFLIQEYREDGTLFPSRFSITERLGTPMMALHPDCAFQELGGFFLSYTDNAGVDYQTGTASFCDSFTGIAEPSKAFQISVFPNPGSEQLQVSFTQNPSAQTLLVHDIHGRLVTQQAIQRFPFTLDTSSWSSGQYILSVVGGAGQYFSTKWSKQ